MDLGTRKRRNGRKIRSYRYTEKDDYVYEWMGR